MPRNESKYKIKWYFSNIFLCILTYNWRSDNLSTSLNFEKKSFFVYFKSQISKCHIYKKLLPHILRHMHPSGQNDKLTLCFFHYQTPCRMTVFVVFAFCNINIPCLFIFFLSFFIATQTVHVMNNNNEKVKIFKQ